MADTHHVQTSDKQDDYSRFVKAMRVVLPVAALALVAIVILRSGGQDEFIEPVPIAERAPDLKDQKISRNELVNPSFESTDQKSQPYKITAARAVQGERNKDLIMLERPVGQMTMSGDAIVKVSSETGAYRQDTERFFLQGGVFMEHEEGYTLFSEEAHIDLKQKFAWSEKDVKGLGPDMSIKAKGITANGETGEIVFSGPVKLVLDKGFKGL